MKKDYRASVVEFVATLSDEEVRFVATRLSDRYSGDMSEALNYLSSKPVVDVILSSAGNADEFFDYCDGIREVAYKEIKRRSATLIAAGEFDPRQKHQGDRPRQFDGPVRHVIRTATVRDRGRDRIAPTRLTRSDKQ